MDTIHPFEAAGLGKAPFTFLGVEEKVGPITLPNGTQVGAQGQPMGCCDYCYTGIRYEYIIRSADGQVHKVGCECIRKIGDRKLKAAVREQQTKARHVREDKRIAEGREWVTAHEQELVKLPHPNKFHAEKGLTLLDYFTWMFTHAGRSGKLEAIKVARTALA